MRGGGFSSSSLKAHLCLLPRDPALTPVHKDWPRDSLSPGQHLLAQAGSVSIPLWPPPFLGPPQLTPSQQRAQASGCGHLGATASASTSLHGLSVLSSPRRYRPDRPCVPTTPGPEPAQSLPSRAPQSLPKEGLATGTGASSFERCLTPAAAPGRRLPAGRRAAEGKPPASCTPSLWVLIPSAGPASSLPTLKHLHT